MAALSGCAYICWTLAPVIDTVGIQRWRAAGLVVAMGLGATGTAVVRSFFAALAAVVAGFVTSAAWTEAKFSDVTVEAPQSVVAALSNQGGELLLPAIVGAVFGAFVTHRLMRKPPI